MNTIIRLHTSLSILLCFPCGASFVACGSHVEVVASAGAGGESSLGGQGGGNAASGGGGSGGATTLPDGQLQGHFMQMNIGNCINGEDWLTFADAPHFTHTLVDRSFCGPHAVFVHPGSYATLPGGVIETQWLTPTEGMFRRFTVTIVDKYPGAFDPMPEGYMESSRKLNTMSYVRTGDESAFRRKDARHWIGEKDIFEQSYSIDVTFDQPLGMPSAPTACTMNIHFVAAVGGNVVTPEQGDEAFVLPCMYGPVDGSSWIRVTANGFENSISDGSWMKHLEMLGISKKYSGQLSNLFYEGFRPVLFMDPSEPRALFHDISWAWYREMLHAPPESVP